MDLQNESEQSMNLNNSQSFIDSQNKQQKRSQQVESYANAMNALQVKLRSLQFQIESQNDEKKQTDHIFTLQLQQKEQDCQNLEQETELLKIKLADLQQKIQTLENQQQKDFQEKFKIQNDLDDKLIIIQNLNLEKKKLTQQFENNYQDLNAVINQLKIQMESQNNFIQNLQDKISQQQKENIQVKTENFQNNEIQKQDIIEKISQIQNLTNKITKLENDMKIQQDNCIQEIQILQVTCEEKQKKIETFEQQINYQNQSISSLKMQLQEQTQKFNFQYENLQENEKKQKLENQLLQNNFDNNLKINQELLQSLQQYNTKQDQLIFDLNEKQNCIDNYKQQIDRMTLTHKEIHTQQEKQIQILKEKLVIKQKELAEVDIKKEKQHQIELELKNLQIEHSVNLKQKEESELKFKQKQTILKKEIQSSQDQINQLDQVIKDFQLKNKILEQQKMELKVQNEKYKQEENFYARNLQQEKIKNEELKEKLQNEKNNLISEKNKLIKKEHIFKEKEKDLNNQIQLLQKEQKQNEVSNRSKIPVKRSNSFKLIQKKDIIIQKNESNEISGGEIQKNDSLEDNILNTPPKKPSMAEIINLQKQLLSYNEQMQNLKQQLNSPLQNQTQEVQDQINQCQEAIDRLNQDILKMQNSKQKN